MLPEIDTSGLDDRPTLGPSPSFLTQPELSSRISKSSLTLPALKQSASAPALHGAKKLPKEIYSRRWTTETRRYLHQHREKRWLHLKKKHCYMDFTHEEKAVIKTYFTALAGDNGMISMETLEDMMISLGLAGNQKEIVKLLEKIDDLKIGHLDFEQFLLLMRARADSSIVRIFKDMMEGKLGDPNLNFQTVISQYRRQLILDASGSRNTSSETQEMGARVLKNFADLRKARYAATQKPIDPDEEALGLSNLAVQMDSKEPTFDAKGTAPMGGLKMVWRGVCTENNLLPDRPSNAKTVDRPPSPSAILAEIGLKVGSRKKNAGRPGTIIVQAPVLEEDGSRRTSSFG